MKERIEQLYRQLSELDARELYSIEPEFCTALYCHIPTEERPSCVTAFLTIANWFSMSQRSGVWTFYEAADPKDIELTLQYLEQTGDDELAAMLRYGAHDYQNPIYAGNFDYPEEWIHEADRIDAWIEKHETWLYLWERKLLTDNREPICSLVRQHPDL